MFLIAFPILYEAISGGMHNIDSEILDAVRIDTNSFITIVTKVKLPLSIPYLLVGLTSSFALSLKTEIMAEIITGDTNYGLGCAISAYRSIDPTDLTPIFAVAFIALVFVLLIDLIGIIIRKHIDIDQ